MQNYLYFSELNRRILLSSCRGKEESDLCRDRRSNSKKLLNYTELTQIFSNRFAWSELLQLSFIFDSTRIIIFLFLRTCSWSWILNTNSTFFYSSFNLRFLNYWRWFFCITEFDALCRDRVSFIYIAKFHKSHTDN